MRWSSARRVRKTRRRGCGWNRSPRPFPNRVPISGHVGGPAERVSDELTCSPFQNLRCRVCIHSPQAFPLQPPQQAAPSPPSCPDHLPRLPRPHGGHPDAPTGSVSSHGREGSPTPPEPFSLLLPSLPNSSRDGARATRPGLPGVCCVHSTIVHGRPGDSVPSSSRRLGLAAPSSADQTHVHDLVAADHIQGHDSGIYQCRHVPRAQTSMKS